jgi:3-dehydroshikimate dehydratase
MQKALTIPAMTTELRDRIGLCSVTFRALTSRRVVHEAAAAGLRVVEWGADVHAPPHSPGVLHEVREQTAASGLTTCSYGSYWRAGVDDAESFEVLTEAAAALGTTRIRVWAGAEGSAGASGALRSRVTGALRDAAAIAAARGLSIALEFHSGTLADTAPEALRLLDDVGDPLSTYWQPPVGEPDDRALDGLRLMLDRVSAIHVFSWWPGQTRLPLHERERLWRPALELAARAAPVDLLLEFVPGDDPAVLPRESATLRRWLA